MLDYHERAEGRLAEKARELPRKNRPNQPAEARLESHRLAKEPPRSDRIGMWRERMTPEEVAEYEAVAGDMLVELGYELGSDAGRQRAERRARRRRRGLAAQSPDRRVSPRSIGYSGGREIWLRMAGRAEDRCVRGAALPTPKGIEDERHRNRVDRDRRPGRDRDPGRIRQAPGSGARRRPPPGRRRASRGSLRAPDRGGEGIGGRGGTGRPGPSRGRRGRGARPSRGAGARDGRCPRGARDRARPGRRHGRAAHRVRYGPRTASGRARSPTASSATVSPPGRAPSVTLSSR